MAVAVIGDWKSETPIILHTGGSLDSECMWAQGFSAANPDVSFHVVQEREGHPTFALLVRGGRVVYEEPVA